MKYWTFTCSLVCHLSIWIVNGQNMMFGHVRLSDDNPEHQTAKLHAISSDLKASTQLFVLKWNRPAPSRNDTRLESLAILVSIIPEQCCGPSQLCINNSSDDNLLHYHLHFSNHFPSKPGFVWCFSFTCFQTRTSGIVIREFSKGCMPFVSSRIV